MGTKWGRNVTGPWLPESQKAKARTEFPGGTGNLKIMRREGISWEGMKMGTNIPLTSIQNTFANDIRSLARSEKVVRNPGGQC